MLRSERAKKAPSLLFQQPPLLHSEFIGGDDALFSQIIQFN
jgi:hypothetical protein